MNSVRKALILIPAMMCMSAAAGFLPGVAGAATRTVSDVAPPPPRIENVPHRDGYVWAAGHWEWNGHSWNWTDGSYLVEQRHAQWIPDAWEQAGAQWRYVPGHWER
jgi:hypothetical protein